tara:strand:- start:2524 stop:3201 length:678 start_codon:yes stop_codon:yes gene_type:complete
MSDSVNSVRVLSIDEEKLKYRILVCVNAPNSKPQKGRYSLVLPPLTAFGNSNHYQQAKIHLDSFTCNCSNLVIGDPVWDIIIAGGAHTFTRLNALEIVMDAPGSQSALNFQTDVNPGDDGVGQMNQGGFRQLVPLKLALTGSGLAALTAGLTNLADYSYLGVDCGNSDGIMCANPFGSTTTLSLRFPGFDTLAYLASHAAGPNSADIGTYYFQFTITLIPNRPSV